MSETNWGESEAPVRKKGIPTWLWFCGGGCLLAVVLAIAGGSFLFVKVKQIVVEGQNPDVQWQHIAELLPYDRRPEMATLKFGTRVFGQEMYWFDDTDGYIVILMAVSDNDESKREKALDPNEAGGAFGKGRRRNMKPATIRIQGRDIKALRFDQSEEGEEKNPDGEPPVGKGPSMLLDVTPEGAEKIVLLQFIRLGDEQQVKDEDVKRFLVPFHVGPDH